MRKTKPWPDIKFFKNEYQITNTTIAIRNLGSFYYKYTKKGAKSLKKKGDSSIFIIKLPL